MEKQVRNSKPRKDLTGKQFGYLTPLYYIKGGKWHCKCKCGNETIVRQRNLLGARVTKSCGCLANETIIQRNINMGSLIQIGDRFGKLTVIADLGMRKQASRDKNEKWFKCRCENCGNENFEVSGNNLQSGQTKSCGCVSS